MHACVHPTACNCTHECGRSASGIAPLCCRKTEAVSELLLLLLLQVSTSLRRGLYMSLLNVIRGEADPMQVLLLPLLLLLLQMLRV